MKKTRHRKLKRQKGRTRSKRGGSRYILNVVLPTKQRLQTDLQNAKRLRTIAQTVASKISDKSSVKYERSREIEELKEHELIDIDAALKKINILLSRWNQASTPHDKINILEEIKQEQEQILKAEIMLIKDRDARMSHLKNSKSNDHPLKMLTTDILLLRAAVGDEAANAELAAARETRTAMEKALTKQAEMVDKKNLIEIKLDEIRALLEKAGVEKDQDKIAQNKNIKRKLMLEKKKLETQIALEVATMRKDKPKMEQLTLTLKNIETLKADMSKEGGKRTRKHKSKRKRRTRR
jgi:hypothetical protein